MFVPKKDDSEEEIARKRENAKHAGIAAAAAVASIGSAAVAVEQANHIVGDGQAKSESVQSMSAAEQQALQEKGPGGITVAAQPEKGEAVITIPTVAEQKGVWQNPDFAPVIEGSDIVRKPVTAPNFPSAEAPMAPAENVLPQDGAAELATEHPE